jgi:hypothetical protein
VNLKFNSQIQAKKKCKEKNRNCFLNNPKVVGLAMLYPIAEALGDAGILEVFLAKLLGQPKTFAPALLRMMAVVALLSAFLSNTATVLLMIPIIVSWSKRMDIHPGKFLMPLSFAAQLGGSATLLGSSHCLIAKSGVISSGYDMGFFDLAPIAIILLLTTSVAILVLSKTTLLRSSDDTSAEEAEEEGNSPNSGAAAGEGAGVEGEDGERNKEGNEGNNNSKSDLVANLPTVPEIQDRVYKLRILVKDCGGVLGKTVQESGFLRMTGVKKISLENSKDDATTIRENDMLTVIQRS